jgi:hypothetical protein
MGSWFKDDSAERAAAAAEKERLRLEAERKKLEAEEEARLAKIEEERRLRLAGLSGFNTLTTDDEEGFGAGTSTGGTSTGTQGETTTT